MITTPSPSIYRLHVGVMHISGYANPVINSLPASRLHVLDDLLSVVCRRGPPTTVNLQSRGGFVQFCPTVQLDIDFKNPYQIKHRIVDQQFCCDLIFDSDSAGFVSDTFREGSCSHNPTSFRASSRTDGGLIVIVICSGGFSLSENYGVSVGMTWDTIIPCSSSIYRFHVGVYAHLRIR